MNHFTSQNCGVLYCQNALTNNIGAISSDWNLTAPPPSANSTASDDQSMQPPDFSASNPYSYQNRLFGNPSTVVNSALTSNAYLGLGRSSQDYFQSSNDFQNTPSQTVSRGRKKNKNSFENSIRASQIAESMGLHYPFQEQRSASESRNYNLRPRRATRSQPSDYNRSSYNHRHNINPPFSTTTSPNEQILRSLGSPYNSTQMSTQSSPVLQSQYQNSFHLQPFSQSNSELNIPTPNESRVSKTKHKRSCKNTSPDVQPLEIDLTENESTRNELGNIIGESSTPNVNNYSRNEAAGIHGSEINGLRKHSPEEIDIGQAMLSLNHGIDSMNLANQHSLVNQEILSHACRFNQNNLYQTNGIFGQLVSDALRQQALRHLGSGSSHISTTPTENPADLRQPLDLSQLTSQNYNFSNNYNVSLNAYNNIYQHNNSEHTRRSCQQNPKTHPEFYSPYAYRATPRRSDRNARETSVSSSEKSLKKAAKKKSGETRRTRTTYTPQQVKILEEYFEESKYVNHEVRVEIALKIGVSEKQVKIWFQNRRMRYKRHNPDARITPKVGRGRKSISEMMGPVAFVAAPNQPISSIQSPNQGAEYPRIKTPSFSGAQSANASYPSIHSNSLGSATGTPAAFSYSSVSRPSISHDVLEPFSSIDLMSRHSPNIYASTSSRPYLPRMSSLQYGAPHYSETLNSNRVRYESGTGIMPEYPIIQSPRNGLPPTYDSYMSSNFRECNIASLLRTPQCVGVQSNQSENYTVTSPPASEISTLPTVQTQGITRNSDCLNPDIVASHTTATSPKHAIVSSPQNVYPFSSASTTISSQLTVPSQQSSGAHHNATDSDATISPPELLINEDYCERSNDLVNTELNSDQQCTLQASLLLDTSELNISDQQKRSPTGHDNFLKIPVLSPCVLPTPISSAESDFQSPKIDQKREISTPSPSSINFLDSNSRNNVLQSLERMVDNCGPAEKKMDQTYAKIDRGKGSTKRKSVSSQQNKKYCIDDFNIKGSPRNGDIPASRMPINSYEYISPFSPGVNNFSCNLDRVKIEDSKAVDEINSTDAICTEASNPFNQNKLEASSYMPISTSTASTSYISSLFKLPNIHGSTEYTTSQTTSTPSFGSSTSTSCLSPPFKLPNIQCSAADTKSQTTSTPSFGNQIGNVNNQRSENNSSIFKPRAMRANFQSWNGIESASRDYTMQNNYTIYGGKVIKKEPIDEFSTEIKDEAFIFGSQSLNSYDNTSYPQPSNEPFPTLSSMCNNTPFTTTPSSNSYSGTYMAQPISSSLTRPTFSSGYNHFTGVGGSLYSLQNPSHANNTSSSSPKLLNL